MQSEKGVSIVITFFIMTMIIVAVSSISAMLYKEVAIVSSIESSVPSLAAANTGLESALYYNRKQGGICNVCDACSNLSKDPDLGCNNCQVVPLAFNGCDPSRCNNCKITYEGAFSGKAYAVSVTVSPNPMHPGIINMDIDSKGIYKGIMRHLYYSN